MKKCSEIRRTEGELYRVHESEYQLPASPAAPETSGCKQSGESSDDGNVNSIAGDPAEVDRRFGSVDGFLRRLATKRFVSMDSSSAPELLSPSSQRRRISATAVEPSPPPSAAELEEFFAEAEKYVQERFAEKYNYDTVKDVPMEGRYKWVRLA